VKRVAGMRTRRLTRGHLRLIRFAHPLWLTSFLALATVFASHRAAGQPSVLTQHNDNARTGQNTNETLLNTSNVNVNDFGLVFSLPVQGQVYAQPLYVPNVTINGTTHNVLIVATEQEYVYAFDADAPAAPLWTASLVDTLHGANPDETAVLGLTELGCKDLQPYVGITSTPAIDPVAGTIYVEAKSTDGTNYFHRLHALDLTTGAEKSQGPAVITATVAGTGDGSTNGQLIFDSFHELNRPGLLLLNGTIYVGFASHCDFSPYHGWLFAYDAATLAQQSVLLTTPNGGMGGFWQSGAGIATDPTGNIYISSGNGTFDTANVPPTELGDTLMKLGTAGGQLSLKDYFTPSDEGCLSTKDLDLGSGGVLVLPEQPGANPHILVAAGKEGAIYVVNRDQLTAGNAHFENSNDCTTDDPEILGESGPGAIGRMFGLPAYWNNTLYFMGAYHVMRSIPIVNGLPNFSQITNNTTTIPYPGATPSVSSNGTTAGSAILWVLDTSQYGPPSATPPGPAVLHAFDATNINTELWNSTQAPNNRDAAGNAVKFAVPTVVSGKVFIGTTNFVNVYGVFNVITFPALPNVTYGASPIKLTAAASSGLAVTYTVTGPAMVSGSTLTITGAGTVNVTASQVGNRDYVAAAPVSQSFTVAQAPLTVTASNFAVPYGQTIPAPTGYIAIGFVNGDTSAVLSGAPAESTTATQGSNAGTYPITITQGTLAAANYSLTFVSGTLTISGGVVQTITFPALPNLTYGTSPIVLAATANSGLAVTYTVTGPAKLSGSTLTITGAGAVTVTASQGGNSDYATATPVSQSFTVARATLTVTADNSVKTYGAAHPPFSYTITGFLNGDTSAVVSGALRETTTATIFSVPGTYPISFPTVLLSATNYTFNCVNGTLTVKPALLGVKVDDATKDYGTSNPAFRSTITGLLNGDKVTVTYRTTASVTSPVGVYPITATVSGPAATNYAIQLMDSELTITKAKLIIKVKDASRIYNEPNPAFSATVVGPPSGKKVTIVYSTAAQEKSPVGKYPITAKISGSSADNYKPDVTDGTLTVEPAPLPAPKFSPEGGSSSKALKVTISDETPGATIFYTKNGSTPTIKSDRYNGPVTVSKSETLRAIATAPNHTKSPIRTEVYIIAP
jgi:hypothetical protein